MDRPPGDGIDDLDLGVRHHLPDGAAAILERVVAPDLGGHRRGLGHAEGNAHLVDPHVGGDALHHLDRTRRARHDPGPQRLQVEVGEPLVAELSDEHGRHAVQARAPLLGASSERGLSLERLRRIHHARPVRGGGEVPEHHPEAVVERHRDAHRVLLAVSEQLAREVAVVEDVVVAERRALREAGGAARVLDVDRVVEVELGHPARQCVWIGRALGERGPLLGVEEDRALERGNACAHVADHLDEVRALQLLGGEDPAAPGLASAYSSSWTR